MHIAIGMIQYFENSSIKAIKTTAQPSTAFCRKERLLFTVQGCNVVVRALRFPISSFECLNGIFSRG